MLSALLSMLFFCTHVVIVMVGEIAGGLAWIMAPKCSHGILHHHRVKKKGFYLRMPLKRSKLFILLHHLLWLEKSTWSISAATAKSLQSCPTLCDPIDGSPPGSPVPGILQARTLERVAISFSNAGKWKVKVKSLGHVWLFTTPWTTAYQAPPSIGFSRQEYWSGVPLLSLEAFLLQSK